MSNAPYVFIIIAHCMRAIEGRRVRVSSIASIDFVRVLPTGNQIGSNGGPPRKNHPLCHETIRWKSDVPLTEGQLRSKRDEFWDTAPAFDGRKEIWDALRAATVAAESLDFPMSQAILDGANISVPNGLVDRNIYFGCFGSSGAVSNIVFDFSIFDLFWGATDI